MVPAYLSLARFPSRQVGKRLRERWNGEAIKEDSVGWRVTRVEKWWSEQNRININLLYPQLSLEGLRRQKSVVGTFWNLIGYYWYNIHSADQFKAPGVDCTSIAGHNRCYGKPCVWAFWVLRFKCLLKFLNGEKGACFRCCAHQLLMLLVFIRLKNSKSWGSARALRFEGGGILCRWHNSVRALLSLFNFFFKIQ